MKLGNRSKSPTGTAGGGRRAFLKRVTAGAGAAAAEAAYQPIAEAAGGWPTPPERNGEGGGYRETDHIRTYYELARF